MVEQDKMKSGIVDYLTSVFKTKKFGEFADKVVPDGKQNALFIRCVENGNCYQVTINITKKPSTHKIVDGVGRDVIDVGYYYPPFTWESEKDG